MRDNSNYICDKRRRIGGILNNINKMNEYKILISGDYNVFNEGWNNAGVYMCSGLYQSDSFRQTIYIGSSENLRNRIEKEHIPQLCNKTHYNPILQAVWNKYKETHGFIWLLLEECNKQDTLIHEEKYLNFYKPFVDDLNGYNISHSAISPMKNRKHSEEAKLKIVKNRKTLSSWNKGKHLSESHKNKIKQSHLLNPPNKNRKFSKEWRENMSKWQNKKVICLETGEIYESAKIASLSLGLSKGSVNQVCSGRRKCRAGGFNWKYLEDYKKENIKTQNII